jgi:transposase
MQGRKEYQERLFLNFQLSDRIPEDNFYRRLKQAVNWDFIPQATRRYYGTEGQQSIDPIVFFKLVLVGYLENVASDRRIMGIVSMRLDIMFFLGYNIDEPLPWHSTLSRTRQLYGEQVFRDLFKTVLRQCIEKGMVAGCRQAVDSALIKANASLSRIVEKEIIDDADKFADELLAERENEQANSISGSIQPEPGKELKLEKLERREVKPFSNSTHVSTTDRDSRIAVKPGKATQLNYLAQTSVDTANHVITHIHADHADKRDSQCLPKILDGLRENLGSEGLSVDEILADTGYSSGQVLQRLEQERITAYIPNIGSYKSDREGFTYHADGDYYTCSQGQILPFKNIRDKGGYPVKEYNSAASQCKGCPIREACLGKLSRKRIRDSIDKPYYDRMHQRLKGPYAKRTFKLRQSTVEPVLGTLINFLGLRRLNTRGILSANKCMLMAATAYNLKKLLRFKTPSRISLMARPHLHNISHSPIYDLIPTGYSVFTI